MSYTDEQINSVLASMEVDEATARSRGECLLREKPRLIIEQLLRERDEARLGKQRLRLLMLDMWATAYRGELWYPCDEIHDTINPTLDEKSQALARFDKQRKDEQDN